VPGWTCTGGADADSEVDVPELLLSCRAVNKAYGGVQAVSDACLEVRAGEILGLVGPNGAGKTTFVDVITGQQRADSGTMRIGTVELTGSPSKRSRLAGLARTFQHPQLALDLTVRENILLGGIATAMASPLRVVAQVFAGAFRPSTTAIDVEIVGLADELHLTGLDRLCADLTLGEQRLVEVARALLRKPTVLLLDSRGRPQRRHRGLARPSNRPDGSGPSRLRRRSGRLPAQS
jgi:branched-chain amino acid transport system ATP-binding protein